jgi:putative NADH-flavin reductase
MKIVVFGASGQVGRQVVQKLLDHGNQVRAFVHGNNPFNDDENLEVITGDIHDQGSVKKAVVGCDAVVSTLGSWGTKQKDILSSGMINAIAAMQSARIERIVSLTGAAAFDEHDNPSLVDKTARLLTKLTARKILEDGEKHIELLRSSQLGWTVVRSPIMLGGESSGYELSHKSPLPWATIQRADVSSAIVTLVEGHEYTQASPFIRRK